jgi:hypothetical protein
MLADIRLLLPALTPSWRFFDSVGPSPRIEIAVLQTPGDAPDWREFRPRPAVVSVPHMLRRLFWNPDRNESLFVTSCAERLLQAPAQHSLDEIETRIATNLPDDAPLWWRWRIVLVSRRDAGIVREVACASPARRRS